MKTLSYINYLVSVIFFVCYFYQMLYIPVSLILRKKPTAAASEDKSYAVLICARNEACVIGDLVQSINRQTYKGAVKVFVIADNCTDNTAEIAASFGAVVYKRQNKEFVGKGYALEALLNHIREDYPEGFDGYFVFDADNILEPDYIAQMNKTFSQGHDIVAGFRNSKNYGDNWISAGYALWFLRESRYLHYPRYLLGFSCNVSGTGFMFSRKVAEEISGWPFHTLTEDIEFSVDQITGGRKIAFCKDAVLYDEQPTTFAESWKQRLRWSKGYLQVFAAYGTRLVKGIFRGSFSCFDMTMNIAPAFVLSIIALICNIVLGIIGALKGEDLMIGLRSIGEFMWSIYSVFFMIGGITTITEWKKIRTSAVKKIRYVITFPFFMITFLPISIEALFTKVQWAPIKHSVTAKTFYKNTETYINRSSRKTN